MSFFQTEGKRRREGTTKFAPIFAGTLFITMVTLLGFSACGGDENSPSSAENASSRERYATFADSFSVSMGEKTLRLRMALTESEYRQGLTGCRGLEENSGMLFVSPEDASRLFWMRGVPVDLSIGFFDAAGTLLEIYEMKAYALGLTSARSERVRYVLEMPAGWFSSNGIFAGTRLNLSEVEAAVRSRGFVYLAESMKRRK